MLVIRLMHIADMPSVPEMMKQQEGNRSIPKVDATAPEKPKTITINSATDLANALQDAREMILYSYFSKNIEISEIANNKISYFDRGDDADFQSRLATWLNTKTGATWMLNKIEESPHSQTVVEQNIAEIEADPMVADAMSLFQGAEIVGSTK